MQQGERYSSAWATGSVAGCVWQADDGRIFFPAPLRTTPGEHSASIIFDKGQKPSALDLTVWREVDRSGFPTGAAEDVPYELMPRLNLDDLTIDWVASFQFELGGEYFLDVFGTWQDSEGCGTSQDASWAFHLSPEPAPTCRGRVATVEGTPYENRGVMDETVTGTEASDVIVARRGDDRINAGAGDDLICAGRGADIVSGGSGQDHLWAGRGNDRLDGGGNRDRCHGEEGTDRFTRCDR